MLAVVERVRLGGALLLLAGAASLFTIEAIETRTQDAGPRHGYRCENAILVVPGGRTAVVWDLSPSEAGSVADSVYRFKRFELAECVMRVVGDRQTPKKAAELHVIASFYHQLGHSWNIAFDRNAPDSLDHLEWAIQFDAMLGGAFHERLLAERGERYVMIRK